MTQDLPDFKPHPLIRGGHLQTILPKLLFKYRKLPGTEHKVPLEDGDHVVLLENVSSAQETQRETVLIVHGLGSSAHDPGVVRQTERLLQAGFDVFRMNHRGIAEGARLSRGIYHGDRMGDVAAAIEYLVEQAGRERIALVAHSMSANMALKLLGSGAANGWAYLQRITRAICLCPTLDMQASADAIERSLGGLYNKTFLAGSLKYLHRRAAQFEGVRKPGKYKTMVEMDRDYICLEAGYADPGAYYKGCSPVPWLPFIKTRTHILCAANDPVAANSTLHLRQLSNRHIRIHITPCGGHLGYLGRARGSWRVSLWLDEFIEAALAAP